MAVNRCVADGCARIRKSSIGPKTVRGALDGQVGRTVDGPQRADAYQGPKRRQFRYRCRGCTGWEVGRDGWRVARTPGIADPPRAWTRDDSERLAAAAAGALARPVAVVGPDGDRLAACRRAPRADARSTVARAAARNGLVAAPAWSIVPIERAGSLLGFLVMGADGEDDDVQRTVCELLPTLLADQLQRAALLHAHRAAFVRRLASDVRFAPGQAHREAAELGLELADAYWPAILAWRHAVPPASVVETVEREARERAPGSLAASLDGRIVLLHPAGDGDDREAAERFLTEHRRRSARALAPVVARAGDRRGRRRPALPASSAEVAELDDVPALRAARGRRRAGRCCGRARSALERFLRDQLDAAARRRFVDEQLARLIAWDAEHRPSCWRCSRRRSTTRATTRPRAAASCTATRSATGCSRPGGARHDPLEDPDERLAVHVALKLRQARGRGTGRAREPTPAGDGATPPRARGVSVAAAADAGDPHRRRRRRARARRGRRGAAARARGMAVGDVLRQRRSARAARPGSRRGWPRWSRRRGTGASCWAPASAAP